MDKPEQRDLLAEFGHFYLCLESHEAAARQCREQLARIRQEIAKLEPASQAS